MSAFAAAKKAAAMPVGGTLPTPFLAGQPAPAISDKAMTITEGGAMVLFPSREAVFYNRVQIFNRDLSIAALRVFDARRRASATPRDVYRAWTRRQNLSAIAQEQRAAILASLSGDGSSHYVMRSMFAVPKSYLSPAYTKMAAAQADKAYKALTAHREAAAASAGAGEGGAGSQAPASSPPLPGLRVLEALGASGLRSVRFAKEITGLDHVVCNDMDPAAVAAIQTNVALNGLSPDTVGNLSETDDATAMPPIVVPSTSDAVLLMQNHTAFQHGSAGTFDAVDLDPYGTASPFLDGAVQAVADGGLLLVTCTDMAVLAGNNMDTAYPKYGAIPIRAKHCHEQALRIVLASIASAAARARRVIRPVLSVSIDFYVRVFVTVHDSLSASNQLAASLSTLVQCPSCEAFWLHGVGRMQGKHTKSSGAEAGASGEPAGKRRKVGEEGAAAVAAAATSSGEGAGALPEAAAAGDAAEGDAAAAGPTHPPARVSRKRARTDITTMPGFYEHVVTNTAPRFLAGPGVAPATQVEDAEPRSSGYCPCCGGLVHFAGPIWNGPLHDHTFVQEVYDTLVGSFGVEGTGKPGASNVPDVYYDLTRTVPRPAHDGGSNDVTTVATSRRRLLGILRSVLDESLDDPLYFDLASLCSRLHVSVPPMPAMCAAIRHAGYRVSGSHATTGVVKTNAPPQAIWDILRAWVAIPGNEAQGKNVPPPELVASRGAEGVAFYAGPVGHILLARPNTIVPAEEVDFSETSEEVVARLAKKAQGPRFVLNPGQHWGPGGRSSAAIAAAAGSATVL